jgi:nucleoside 2-deoxyribosyltransferase
MTKTIYLAGNIAGLHYDDATSWRKQVGSIFSNYGYIVLDPMREKEHLTGSIVGFLHNSNNCSANEIFTRDTNDVKLCDIIFAYITGYSIGTSFELGYAYALKKEIVIVTTDELIRHPFLSESANYITTCIQSATDYVTFGRQ